MAETASTMLPLGSEASDFTLHDTVTGKLISLATLQSPTATVIMFLSNHCPYVKHIQTKVVEVAKKYQPEGISFVAISANDVEKYPEDSPEKMKIVAQKYGYTFPYLYDETQEVARTYHAACTPDFFVFDGNLRCVYRGRFDDATPGNNKPVTGKDLCAALDAILENSPVSKEQFASLGCNIKWKSKI